MEKYKLVVYVADEQRTKEFDNVVSSLDEAEEKASILLAEYSDGYSDAYVACYDYDEDITLPGDDYRCWKKDADDIETWWWMKMGTYCRIGLYLA